MNSTRRSFLSGIRAAAGAWALSSMLPVAARGKSSLNSGTLATVNLVFHGSFAFLLTDPIQVITGPYNPEHSYCFEARAGFKSMEGAYVFEPAGVNKGNKPAPDATRNLLINATDCGFTLQQAGRNGQARCTLTVPYPKSMVALRPFDNSIMTSKVYLYGMYANKIKTTSFPLIQVLSYDVKDATKVQLTAPVPSDSWTPSYNTAKTVNLHIFAEPSTEVSPYHAQEAFAELATQVHQNLADLFSRVWPDSDPPGLDSEQVILNAQISDLWPEDELTLAERALPAAKKSAGIRIVNCMNLIIQ